MFDVRSYDRRGTKYAEFELFLEKESFLRVLVLLMLNIFAAGAIYRPRKYLTTETLSTRRGYLE
jgi:hypothetical protein